MLRSGFGLARLRRSQPRISTGHGGFSVLELLMVLVVLALLSGLGAARLAPPEAFEAASAAQELSQLVRLGQRLAVAQQRPVHVWIDAAAHRAAVCWDSACLEPVITGTRSAVLVLPERLRWGGVSWRFSFAASGAASLGEPARVALADESGQALGPVVIIEPDSGDARVE